MLKVIQIGMNSRDMAGSLQLFSDVFGFENAGAQALWGEPIRIQSLGEGARAVVWWLLGREQDAQIELFQHTKPAQRLLREDWRPSDLGWVRFGVSVTDFPAALSALQTNGVSILAPPVERDGISRVAFRDPFVGAIVEIVSRPHSDADSSGTANLPSLLYATSSVASLAGALSYYRDALGMTIDDLDTLHSPEDEKLWGLAGARRKGFVAHLGGLKLEVLEYESPRGRPKSAEYRVSDQGLVNIGLRADSVAEAESLLSRLNEAGYTTAHVLRGEGVFAFYITDFEREVEVVALPDAVADAIGFSRGMPFMGVA